MCGLQARDRLQIFRDTRPAESSRKAGASREDVVDKMAEELLAKVSGYSLRVHACEHACVCALSHMCVRALVRRLACILIIILACVHQAVHKLQ